MCSATVKYHGRLGQRTNMLLPTYLYSLSMLAILWKNCPLRFPTCRSLIGCEVCTLSAAAMPTQVTLASERSQRDTYRGNTIENRGCLLASERIASETVLDVYGWYVCPLNARAGNVFLLKARLFRLDSNLF